MVGIVADPLGTATAMLAALDAGMVSSVELVEMHLARIEALDGKLNAIPVPTPERALEEAAQADELRASGRQGCPPRLADDAQGVDAGRRVAAVGGYRVAR